MNKASFKLLRWPLIFAVMLLFVISLIGAAWGWAIALSFVVGGMLFSLCCFLTYQFRSTYHFNNIVDAHQNIFFAFFTNRERFVSDGSSRNRSYKVSDRYLDSSHPRTTHYVMEEFTPFHFKPERDPQEEERIVRALLRQVFSDDIDI